MFWEIVIITNPRFSGFSFLVSRFWLRCAPPGGSSAVLADLASCPSPPVGNTRLGHSLPLRLLPRLTNARQAESAESAERQSQQSGRLTEKTKPVAIAASGLPADRKTARPHARGRRHIKRTPLVTEQLKRRQWRRWLAVSRLG